MNSKFGSANDTPKFVARYIDNFIDLVENIPNDLSRRVSLIHELQLDYESSLSKLEHSLTKFSRPNNENSNDLKQLKLLLTTQNCLIRMQEISDNKLAIIQDALDRLDSKSRELDHDFRMIGAAGSEGSDQQHNNTNNNNSKSSKSNANNDKGKSSSSNQTKISQRGESPEPTYCVCRQVSFGDMICCDNDACEIEWFHFQCVSLATKPKGKWYCPNCRGERSNQPKR